MKGGIRLLTQCPCGTVQTGTGKVDPARKLKCTTAARERERKDNCKRQFSWIVFEIAIQMWDFEAF